MTRAFMIAAPRSGGGKTTVTLGLLAALRARGVAVRAAKTGPDYIDPAFHEAATGRPSLNLDSWVMPPALLDTMVAEAASGAEVLVVESAMGLFDGLAGPDGARGAPSDVAARFALPVVLVLDVSGQGQSAAAIAHGFATLDTRVRVAGVILNRVASARHRSMAEGAIRAAGLPVFGALMRDDLLHLPERHLGLVQAREQDGLSALFARLGGLIEGGIDLDALLAAAGWVSAGTHHPCAMPPPGQRIAVADDAAFSFFYGHLAQGWRRAGAELLSFSPLADEAPDDTATCCWLPGGYPELHAAALSAATRFRDGVARFAMTRPVHGECGGFMVLGRGLEDAQGVTHPMCTVLDHVTSYAKRRMSLGYREATLLADGVLGTAGSVLRGHEFHYARVTDAGSDAPLAALRDGMGQSLGTAGGRRGHVSGSFFHVMARHTQESVA
ncbi:cobyrinic acid a,c-diamide synthase [Ameyamaea chiangmaiensis NBRC 103196]|uniref:Cobyrinate a,c-diamide synthase n=1 Tax=Ameyamaea chiangmaiensis TaxID=442969 RepID=A0A850PGU2_9PROT|nr:cobyrinate a,c-diamide synthase [Ameyamaea chiangmaiensis]MBS4076261.1 cobyrinate a,c-diamide synthase [Ameyamaea chiangmaiensis]NVN41456.1 cobyrinate a,c-diamide synthase [Ameyamaea chiangmaiensis]GBQ64742.1 cobyrinic acid a,c-diamide synthase [Ameyamaea chiangmaiensis NBRC 103196]